MADRSDREGLAALGPTALAPGSRPRRNRVVGDGLGCRDLPAGSGRARTLSRWWPSSSWWSTRGGTWRPPSTCTSRRSGSPSSCVRLFVVVRSPSYRRCRRGGRGAVRRRRRGRRALRRDRRPGVTPRRGGRAAPRYRSRSAVSRLAGSSSPPLSDANKGSGIVTNYGWLVGATPDASSGWVLGHLALHPFHVVRELFGRIGGIGPGARLGGVGRGGDPLGSPGRARDPGADRPQREQGVSLTDHRLPDPGRHSLRLRRYGDRARPDRVAAAVAPARQRIRANRPTRAGTLPWRPVARSGALGGGPRHGFARPEPPALRDHPHRLVAGRRRRSAAVPGHGALPGAIRARRSSSPRG